MKSVKPGRGPSAMGAVLGVVVALVGVGWTIAALSMGAPWFMALFGIAFVIISVVLVIYNYHNATGKNRFSEFDITENGEEPDPLQPKNQTGPAPDTPPAARAYCPFCGAKVRPDFQYCEQCGRQLP